MSKLALNADFCGCKVSLSSRKRARLDCQFAVMIPVWVAIRPYLSVEVGFPLVGVLLVHIPTSLGSLHVRDDCLLHALISVSRVSYAMPNNAMSINNSIRSYP